MGSSYISEVELKSLQIVLLSLSDDNGTIDQVFQILNKHDIHILHMESRISKNDVKMEFLIECQSAKEDFDEAAKEIQKICSHFQIISSSCNDKKTDSIPWFPVKIKELDRLNDNIFFFDSVVDKDYPALTDSEYMKRRKYITDFAYKYKHGQEIAKIDYTEEEVKTWGTIYRNVTKLHKTKACEEYNRIFPLLVYKCGYREDNIPQFQDVSEFLKECSGFQLRPVAGLLSPRDFLSCLAFRVLPCTQYIRHPSTPFYTPEPDVCHELLGHVPLFCDPKFAQLTQEIGLASLGAPTEYIEKLASCYWFTAEFGLCRQNGELKAYGAGLLGGADELQYCLSDVPEVRDFNPEKASVQEYPLNGFQTVYFATAGFDNTIMKMRQFERTVPRPFAVWYNSNTQTIEILNSKTKILSLMKTVEDGIGTLHEALTKCTIE